MENMADIVENGLRALEVDGRIGGKIDTAVIIEAGSEISMGFKFECMKRGRVTLLKTHHQSSPLDASPRSVASPNASSR
jgi:hypothetical protein